MVLGINKNLPVEFRKYNIAKIQSGASNKKFYRLSKDKHSIILIDFDHDKKEYSNHLKIYNLLKNLDISIPKIIEKNTNELFILTEDFGNLRFDLILKRYPLNQLLQYAVDTLIVIKNSIEFDNKLSLDKYSFEIFKKEISEMPEYYFDSIELNNKNLVNDFFNIWEEAYKNKVFQFNNFVHKDFNINNLILLPHEHNHLKCGVIDFQSGFWGENCWDLFSLLEDSRTYFSNDYNDYFINHYYSKTKLNISLNEFKKIIIF